MSYCRFSSDSFKSDVYMYESVDGGYQIYVAENRIVDQDNIPPFDITDTSKDSAELHDDYQKHIDYVRKAERRKIGGKHDGEAVIFGSLKEAYDYLLILRDDGYHVPEATLNYIAGELEKGE